MPDDLPRRPAPRPLEILEALAPAGVLRDLRVVEPGGAWDRRPGIVAVVEGEVELGDRWARLQVSLTDDFPSCLPLIAVDPSGELASLPHVEAHGVVCFRPEDEPLLDRGRPFEIVRGALAFAADTLRKGLLGNRAEEFANEVVAYWRHATPEARTVLSLVEPDDTPRIVTAFLDPEKRVTVADDPAALAAFLPHRSIGRLSFVNGLYVPIDPAGMDADFHPRMLATPEGFRAFVAPVLARDKPLWHRILARCRSREVLVLLGVRRPSGRRGLVGLILKEGPRAHPLDPDLLASHRIVLVRVDPGDRGFVLTRGGAVDALADRRVLVLGCGAVGGYVAMNLARAGVGELWLLDDDAFELANTFRHVCGRACLKMLKVVGLKLEIERLLPFVRVAAYPLDVLDWMKLPASSFRDVDLVVSALGNPTVEMRVNEAIATDPASPPALFAWLEPLGLGGHVLLTHVGADPRGCFECLYEHDGNGALVCRTAFATPGIQYTRDVMGCGSQHTAFGDLDAQKTAALVTRRALDVLRGGVTEGQITSWRGNPVDFRAAGFKTTKRFDEGADEIVLPAAAVLRPTCPLCNRP